MIVIDRWAVGYMRAACTSCSWRGLRHPMEEADCLVRVERDGLDHTATGCFPAPDCSCGKPFSQDGGAEGVCECCSGCAGGAS